MSNLQEVNDFINASNLKNKEDLAGIFSELVVKYSGETSRQHSIRGMVMLFESKYPEEVKQHAEAMKVAKEQAINEFGANENMDMRRTFRIPQGLMTRINMVVTDPSFLTQEADKMFGEVSWFKENFPRYFIPNVL